MREFFHSCYTCPQCHEPYNDSIKNCASLSFLKNGNIQCSECNTEFHPTINLIKDNLELLSFLSNQNELNSPFNFNSFPFFWKVTLNEIEKNYSNWIQQNPLGIHLITWPWSEIRFLPILLTNYCLLHEKEKVVIIGDYEERDNNSNFINGYSLPEIIKNTIFIEEPSPVSDELKNKVTRLRSKKPLFFDKKNEISVKYRKYGDRDLQISICPNTLKKCINEIKKSLIRDYGPGSIRTISKYSAG